MPSIYQAWTNGKPLRVILRPNDKGLSDQEVLEKAIETTNVNKPLLEANINRFELVSRHDSAAVYKFVIPEKSIFKKNGDINYGNLGVFCGFGDCRFKNEQRKINHSVSASVREASQRQFDTLTLGGLAMAAGFTVEDMTKLAKENRIGMKARKKLSSLKNAMENTEFYVEHFNSTQKGIDDLLACAKKMLKLSKEFHREVKLLPVASD